MPVYPGASEPMVKNLSPQRGIPVPEPVLAGVSEIDGVEVFMNPDLLPLPDSPNLPEPVEAALFYVDYLRNTKERVTLIATGTMTNLGLALTMAPDIAANIEEIVVMGGGIRKANITAAAEANFFKDPEAAAIVLRSGVPITICSLDATHSCALTEDHEKQIRAIGTAASIFTANDIHVRRESYAKFQPLERVGSAPIHDALCVAYLVDPSVVVEEEWASCYVDCSEGISDGRLQSDKRYFRDPANVRLVLKADPDKMCEIVVDIFREGELHK